MISKSKIITLLWIAIFLLFTVACTSQKEVDEEDSTEAASKENKTVEKETDKEKDQEGPLTGELEKLSEESVDPLSNLLERAPDEPSSVEEIVNYPTGPLAGKDYKEDMDEMVKVVKQALPAIEDDVSDAYLGKWWRAYRYLFAEDYPDQIINQMNLDFFGNPGIKDEKFQFKEQMNVLVILDVSGSMANTIDGKSMVDIAKDSIRDFTSDLPEEANIGLRVYGHEGKSTGKTKEQSCESSELVYDIQPIDKQEFQKVIEPFEPTGWTPIGFSLEKAKEDFADFPGEKNTNLVYVVSDGAETCDGDPTAAAKELAESDIQSIVNVIGFNVGIEGQKHLKEIANAGGGVYTNAGNEKELQEAFDRAKEILAQWREWKSGAKEDAFHHSREQTINVINFSKKWFDMNWNENSSIQFVNNQLLFEGYISKDAYHYFDNKRGERFKLYSKLKEEAHTNLMKKVKNNYEELMDQINEKYDKNTKE